MVGPFALSQTPQIIFGTGKIKSLPEILPRYGTDVLLVTGAKSFMESHHWDQLLLQLEVAKIPWRHFVIDREPSPEMIDRCVLTISDPSPSVVVAVGGGSVLDAGKAISAMYKQEGSVADYLEGVGSKKPSGKKLPFIAVPTTSGTGSEATKNAVITRTGPDGFKKSLRHDRYVPDLALVDPELTLSCSPEQTARSGMDAFTQLLESYLSTKATPLTDALAIDALRILRDSLPEAVEKGRESLDARSGMSYAALISGITLANAGLGTVHGFASSIGGFFDIPHGLVCGTLMGVVNRRTVEKLLKTNENPEALKKYARVGKIFTRERNKTDPEYALALTDLIGEWTGRFGIGKLSDFGIAEKDTRKIARSTSNKYNPVIFSVEELEEMVRSRL